MKIQLILLLLIISIFLCIALWWYIIYNNNNNNNNNNILNDVKKHTYYLNLKHRKDRNEETLKELKSFGIQNPTRYNAIEQDNGAIGCSKSHLEVLKIARKKNLPYVLVVEDDIKFIDPDLTNKTLNNVLNSRIDWDVILLGGNNNKPYNKINEDCVKVNNCLTTTAYLVKQSYYDTLINQWKEGLQKLIETEDEPKFALDQYWKHLQKRDNFLLLTPLNVVQRESYSDIQKGNIDYSDMMLDLK